MTRFLIGALVLAITIGLVLERIPGPQATMPYHVLRFAIRPADEVLPMPVRGVKVRSVADTWGAPRPGDRKHQGQDIFAKRGTPVFSATEGIVVRMGDQALGGNTVFVLGPGGRTYYYAHLDRYAADLTVGTLVTPATVLGYVGNTGNARTTPPHLHFGVYAQGGAMNPHGLLADRAQWPEDSSDATASKPLKARAKRS